MYMPANRLNKELGNPSGSAQTPISKWKRSGAANSVLLQRHEHEVKSRYRTRSQSRRIIDAFDIHSCLGISWISRKMTGLFRVKTASHCLANSGEEEEHRRKHSPLVYLLVLRCQSCCNEKNVSDGTRFPGTVSKNSVSVCGHVITGLYGQFTTTEGLQLAISRFQHLVCSLCTIFKCRKPLHPQGWKGLKVFFLSNQLFSILKSVFQ